MLLVLAILVPALLGTLAFFQRGPRAALALLTNTDLLFVILGGVFVLEAASVVIQIFAFHAFGRRVFRMAPLHHHFELLGWPESTVIVRFWILAALGVALALGIFYGDFIMAGVPE